MHVCVSKRESVRERKRGRGRDRGREIERGVYPCEVINGIRLARDK